MTAQTLTLTQFLEARIAEDEALAGRVALDYPGAGDWESLKDRVLAECAAKRAIVADHAPADFSWTRYEGIIGSTRQVGDPEPACLQCTGSIQKWRVTRPEPIWEDWTGMPPRVIAPCDTLRALASVYADHELYRAEWKL